jgi:D-amino-acid dehydrogenase
VRPAKGYSITFDVPPGAQSLRTPLVDDHRHAAIVPLQDAIRVVSTAEFAGYDKRLDPVRIRNLMRLLPELLPQTRFDASTARPWSGLRPMSVDGVPIIGATSIPNLFVNTGHGHLGWTMAAGSAKLLSDLISGDSSSVDPSEYSLARFA